MEGTSLLRLAGRLCLCVTVLLTLRLTPVSTVTLEPSVSLGTILPDPPRSRDSNPSLELRFEPRTMRLWWDCGDDKLSTLDNLTCEMTHKSGSRDILTYHDPGVCECQFNPTPLHEGIIFTVKGTVRGRPVQGRYLYENPGPARSAAGNFSCVIYGGRAMNCSWTRGSDAPDDVQYALYLRYSRVRQEVECPRYVPESGTHLGCHVTNLTGFRSPMYFLLNGTSPRSRVRIRFFDAILSLKRIEIYDPPSNITAQCNVSHCLLAWTRPRSRLSLGDRHFQYQLRMLRQGEPTDDPLINIPGVDNPYVLPSPEPRGHLQVQLRSCKNIMLPDDPWSAWSQPVCLGREEPKVTMVLVYFLVVVGTLVCGCAAVFVGHRFLGPSKICPRVPQVRDKVTHVETSDQQVNWEESLTGVKRTQSEQVLIVSAPETVLALAESHFGDSLKGVSP